MSFTLPNEASAHEHGQGRAHSAWDALSSQAKSGISPQMAKRVLELNPKLGEAGLTPTKLVAEAQHAHRKSAANAGAALPGAMTAFHLLDQLKDELSGKESRVDQAMARLTEERQEQRARTLASVIKWLLANDPDLRSPMTQQSLLEQKAFLDSIGFSLKAYAEEVRQLGRR